MTIVRKYNDYREEIQGTELGGAEKKEYQTIYDNTYTFLIKKSYNNGEKDT